MKKVSFKYLLILIIPIFIELLLQILAGNVDKFMVRNDDLATSINQANSVLDLLIVAISVLASSSLILINQYKGAKLKDKENGIYKLAFYFYLFISLILSIILFSCARPILLLMRVESKYISDAKLYLALNGGFIFLQAIMICFQNYLRSNDLTKHSLLISITFNLFNILLNAIFLYALDMDPILAVALGSIISRFIGVVLLFIIYKIKINISISPKGLFPINFKEIKKLIGIGLPSAMESINYSLTQIVILAIINIIGKNFEASAPISKTYASMIATITYLFVNATSQGMQIILSRYLGAGEIELAKRLVVKTMITSIIVSTIMAIMMAIFSEQIFGIFTNNKDVIKLCKYIMLVEIALELGRAVNMVLVRALQTSGDVMYPTILAIICCWLIATLLSYILGLRLEYGLVGIWIAMAMDELIRACLFIVRFIRGKWLKIKIVNS